MNTMEALALLDRICSQVPLNRMEHNKVLEAIKAIHTLIEKDQKNG